MSINNFFKKPIIRISTLTILILWSVLFSYYLMRDFLVSEKEMIPSTEFKTGFRSVYMPRKIDGVLVPEEETNLYPIAIIIENMVDGRPSSGLSKANLVYEAVAEAGITRFLAFYSAPFITECATTIEPSIDFTNSSNLTYSSYKRCGVKKIGPIRSARPYFLDWAEELKALYLHVGGSPQALKEIPSRKIIDLNEYFNGQYFWRENNRPRPHNVYTSSELLTKALSNKKIPLKGDYEGWLYKTDGTDRTNRIKSSKITITFSTPDYQVEWFYQPLTNNYLRFQAGQAHIESDGSRIVAKNIIVQVVETQILDEIGRRKMETWGEGKAFIFQDGQVIEGKWIKNRPNCSCKTVRTKFYDEFGEEVKFNRGTTWVEIIPDIKLLNY